MGKSPAGHYSNGRQNGFDSLNGKVFAGANTMVDTLRLGNRRWLVNEDWM